MEMKGEIGRGRVTAVALLPVMLGLLAPLCAKAGRLAWLAPVLALPVGAVLCLIWRKAEGRTLAELLEAGLGHWGGKATQLLYIVWGHVLLTESARRYARRLLALSGGENVRWLYLAVGLLLALWLGRDGKVLLRSGRLFFDAVAVALVVTVTLSLPGMDWKELYPPDGVDWAGLPGGALCVAALSGYAVFGLCLPGEERSGRWMLTGCGTMVVLLAVTLGVFGPALAVRMEEPFLLLLEGGGTAGAFRRSAAILSAVLILADLALFAFLVRGCGSMWEGLFGVRGRWGEWLLELWALLGAGLFPVAEIGEGVYLWGGVLLGIVLPGIVVFTGRVTEAGGTAPISCAKNDHKAENIGRAKKM